MKIYDLGIISNQGYEEYGMSISFGLYSSLELAKLAIPTRPKNSEKDRHDYGLYYIQERELDSTNSSYPLYVWMEDPSDDIFHSFEEPVEGDYFNGDPPTEQ